MFARSLSEVAHGMSMRDRKRIPLSVVAGRRICAATLVVLPAAFVVRGLRRGSSSSWSGGQVSPAVGGTDGAALPDTTATVTRLQQNQDDIGAAIVPYFGQAAGDRLASLLHEHISGAVTLLLAAKAGDAAAVDAAKTAWYANGQQIADFLSAANPKYWPDDTMREDMKTHLDQTLQEAVDQIQHNIGQEAGDYEAAHQHILMMADTLSAGIIQKFRNQFDQ
jgi:hypothetical protein